MDYRKYGETLYVRMDRGDEIIGGILDICKKEQIRSAVFQGIGGCGEAQIQTYLPETKRFETQTIQKTQAGEEMDIQAFADALKAKYPDYADMIDAYITMYQTYGAEGFASMMDPAQ